ncbi:uncharacterized protein B0T23DRAFT_193252 [Neurospora hispaniola]|uniref:Uncharacterized protein n=1 Tax=Neurospora hispaniola TaxID=588809 RepID=A0AAJ0I3X4_9PEZI|nr:hypothetical protein B0T23DRAFT_193252 [Neurospora hispaniola]
MRSPCRRVRRKAQDARFQCFLLFVVSSRAAEPFPNASHLSALTEVYIVPVSGVELWVARFCADACSAVLPHSHSFCWASPEI